MRKTSPETTENIVANIKKYMQRNNLTKTEFARQCGVSLSLISRIINKKRGSSITMLDLLAKAMKTEARELISSHDDKRADMLAVLSNIEQAIITGKIQPENAVALKYLDEDKKKDFLNYWYNKN